MADSQNKKRIKIRIHGAVQGVGFRPFVYRMADRYRLTGWVRNNSHGVLIEAEGNHDSIQSFLWSLQSKTPRQAHIQSVKFHYLDPVGYPKFEIIQSVHEKHHSAWILPDIATCTDCLKELFNPKDRRYLYPFINCTQCGPRFSIIERMPYDRVNTSMKSFDMCPECRAEYENPDNRRFHAQPNACPNCGPHMELRSRTRQLLSANKEAVKQAVHAIKAGKIVAVKGLGGFHLMADATNSVTVRRLRKLKHREEKPFALMFPDVASIQSACDITPSEHRWLTAPEAPILLLWKKNLPDSSLAPEIAPDNPCYGAMLPYTPLHHILMKLLNRPVIATSGNISEEPICIENDEAFERLGGIADAFLIHNRPIVRPVDDSVGRLIGQTEMLLRRARGYAPLPILIKTSDPPAAAFGGHLKNTITLSAKNQAIVSQHIGDLETEPAMIHFRRIIKDLQALSSIRPGTILHDMHPDYASTAEALKTDPNAKPVQHHLAHVLSCMLDNEIDPPVLGVSWDGTGYGTDGTIWGGEFIQVNQDKWYRVASLRPFSLVGGEAAIREPRRSALAVLHACFGDKLDASTCPNVAQSFRKDEWNNLVKLLNHRSFSPLTSSIGRLFDVIASMTGILHVNRYEGQAAMLVEYLAWQSNKKADPYSFKLVDTEPHLQIDWEPMIHECLCEINSGARIQNISDRFHWTLVNVILKVAERIGQRRILLSGGCFQNKLLTERVCDTLEKSGYRVYRHQQIPPNDGGISLGQIAAAKYGFV
ncbi:carbamoyltransferase HypF [bacterium]|nr:carbamoyltransferase HypF [bacterium]